MTSDHALIKTFTEKAEAVSARVVSVASPMEAFAHAAGICDAKQACQRLVSGCEAPLSEKADTLCETKQAKVMAAPNLSAAEFADLEKVCQEKSIRLIKENLHSHLAGIDIGFTWADYAIAETGTLVLHCTSEDLRLATMVSEIHMALVPVSRIKATSLDLTGQLTDWMRDSANYTAMITGASRTADIERVLALGVHGPLELHILLMEDN
jgi:L-lactate dehydrogenase complex protein LldG